MPNTPVYSLPYPALSDPPNGAAQIQALAERVEATMSLAVVTTVTAVVSPVLGQVVFALDTLRAHRYTGSGWVPLNPNMPACVLVDNVDRSIPASTASWVGLAVVDEQTTISGNVMAVAGAGGTSSANSPTITIRESGLYDVGFRVTWATDGSNGAPVKVIGVTRNSTSASITRSTCLTSANAPTQGTTTQTEGQGVTADAVERFTAGEVLRPVCVASGAAFINSASTSFAQGGVSRFWAYKIRD